MKIHGVEIEKIRFGGSPGEIDDLESKVLTGEKVSTSSLLDFHLLGMKKRSMIGACFSVLNSFGKEVAIVRVERIEIIKFGEIGEDFAIEEGDGRLENWLAIHQPYYSKLLSGIGKELNTETLLACEWFEVVRVF